MRDSGAGHVLKLRRTLKVGHVLNVGRVLIVWHFLNLRRIGLLFLLALSTAFTLGPASVRFVSGPAFVTTFLSANGPASVSISLCTNGSASALSIMNALSPAAVADELVVQAFAPSFSLKTLTRQQMIHSAELFAEHPFTLLVFWNRDCPECLEALGKCQEFADAAVASGVKLVGINHDIENIASTRSFLKSSNIEFLQLWDPDRLVASSYGTDSYSLSLFLVDSSGVIRELVYNRPAETKKVLSNIMEEYGARSAPGFPRPALPGKHGTEPVPVSDSLAFHVERSPVDTGVVVLPLPRDVTIGTIGRFPVEFASRISITGDVRIRAMDIQMSHAPSIPNPPTGPYGEVIREGTSVAHRAQIELSSKLTSSLTAGVVIRLSNEDEDVLKFGPQYFSRSEGSAYVQYREGDFLLRCGYFDAHFTPLSLMRWDANDNARTGGTASGCICAGATGAILLESLEELRPELTFEGLDLSQAIGDLLDIGAFYARPRVANEISMGEFLANPERLSDFAYRRDLYALRANFNVNYPGLVNPGLMSLHYLRTRDDRESATFVGSQYDPQGFAADNRVYGALVSLPLHDRLSLEIDLERTDTNDNVIDPASMTHCGTGYLAVLKGDILRGVTASLSYLSLSWGFHSSYAALSYLPNRKGVRANVSIHRDWLDSDVFVKFLEPTGARIHFFPDAVLPSIRSEFKNHLTLGLWASTNAPKAFELGCGWLLEREIDDVYRYYVEPIPPSGYQHLELQRRKSTLTLQLVHAFSARSTAELLYQYMDYTDKIETLNDYSVHRTSLQFSVRF
ncbi:MAG: hypothetical protein AMJ46_13800 [Latescibacteria bacterium DG_63]|nr:MAG: hypothetical protein AMJ46_13800 [Latescibacteria bacterium DG_63]